jgi:hypothetical protein
MSGSSTTVARSDPPTRTYKYLPPDRVDVITNGLIRYTQLGALNDPFEGKPNITSIVRDAEARKDLEALLPGETKKWYENLAPEIAAKLSFETFSALVQARASRIEPHFSAIINVLAPAMREVISQGLDRSVGVMSLSEVPDNLLMWSHYAANHTGFVLGFDSRHPYFNERKAESDELRHLRRVEYRDSRPSGPMTGFDGVAVLLVKSQHWAYEREWRIFRPLVDAEVVKQATPYPICLFRYPCAAVEEIILGANIRPSAKEVLAAAVASNQALGHVRFLQAVLDRGDFRLRIEDAAL